MKTWIKICAQTNLPDALASYEAGADAVGFVFAESKRQVTPSQARSIIAQLPAGGEKIGVFVNESAEEISKTVHSTGLTGVQLQGGESPDYLRDLRAKLSPGITVIKAITAEEAEAAGIMGLLNGNDRLADAFLIDSGNKQQRGGTGQTFDWQRLVPVVERFRRSARLIIAGGLRSRNVAEAVALFQPYGVDVATGVESSPGKKDITRLKEFVVAVRSAEAKSATT